ncbi:16S rRNA (guanine(527)-N(7))-methyltransferase RsmG [Methylibium sp.]|uniref:16S rRNA (guanine(527)-N(7))-methyltransferase RsmG n=1 Tax=Methylibium sp. TaxID=2067992 RepID=UPI003D0F24AA
MTSAPADDERLAVGLREGVDVLGLALSKDQQRQLLQHLALIARWNRVYNLTAVRDPAQMLTQHLLDSLAVVQPLRRHTGGGAISLLDVGSGAGLPGVAIAVACPEVAVSCVDAVAKKASFVRQVAAELGLRRFSALHARVESLTAKSYQVVTSRAFASLADFVVLTESVLAPGGVWMAMKGQVPDDEIAALPPAVEMFHVEPLRVPGLDAERCIVWMCRKDD